MDVHWRQQTWLVWVAYWVCNNTVKLIQNHWKIVHNLPLAKTVDLGNKPMNIICCMGMVIHLHSKHFQALCSFISTLHSIWHTVWNQPPVQANDIQVRGHSGKDMTSTKVVMVGLYCSPFHRFQNMGHQVQVCWECLQDCRKTICQLANILQL